MAYDGPGGALFKNNKKTSDRHPDLTGFVELDPAAAQSIVDQMNSGVQHPKLDISAWTKVSQKGNKFISLSAKKPWVKNQSSSDGYHAPAPQNNDMDDSIPF